MTHQTLSKLVWERVSGTADKITKSARPRHPAGRLRRASRGGSMGHRMGSMRRRATRVSRTKGPPKIQAKKIRVFLGVGRRGARASRVFPLSARPAQSGSGLDNWQGKDLAGVGNPCQAKQERSHVRFAVRIFPAPLIAFPFLRRPILQDVVLWPEVVFATRSTKS